MKLNVNKGHWTKMKWIFWSTLTSISFGRPLLLIQGWTSISSFFCSSVNRGWLFCMSLSFSLSSLSTVWTSLQTRMNTQTQPRSLHHCNSHTSVGSEKKSTWNVFITDGDKKEIQVSVNYLKLPDQQWPSLNWSTVTEIFTQFSFIMVLCQDVFHVWHLVVNVCHCRLTKYQSD